MKNNMRRTITLAASATAVSTVLGALALLSPAEATEQARAGPTACLGMEQLTVPDAERLEAACLSDLTTTGTIKSRHTDPSGSTGFGGLSVPGTLNPSEVPVIQLDGYFPDTSTFNTTHGWNHDAQFVIRLPRHWNGGLVVAGSPGIRRQYASMSSSLTRCSPRATPTPLPTRATAARCCTRMEKSRAMPSPSGTLASPSSPSLPRK